jgi:hypothetical protein
MIRLGEMASDRIHAVADLELDACVWHWHRSHLAGISGAHSGAGLQMGDPLQDSCAMQLPVE